MIGDRTSDILRDPDDSLVEANTVLVAAGANRSCKSVGHFLADDQEAIPTGGVLTEVAGPRPPEPFIPGSVRILARPVGDAPPTTTDATPPQLSQQFAPTARAGVSNPVIQVRLLTAAL